MAKDTRPIEVGDRFEDKDPRQAARVIRITSLPDDDHRFDYVVEVAELNPTTVGRHGRIAPRTLRYRYRKISR